MKTKVINGAVKYAQIRQHIAGQIRRGALAPGQQLLPERELMRAYSVSYSTISRALTELRDAGLIERHWGKGTFVRRTQAKASNLAVVFDDTLSVTSPFLATVFRGIGLAAESSNWHMQLYPLPGDHIFGENPEPLLAGMLREGHIQRLISCGAHEAGDIETLARLDIPAVSVNVRYPETHVRTAWLDTADAGQQAVAYLAELGHREIGLILAPYRPNSARIIYGGSTLQDALLQSLEDHGIPVRSEWLINTDSRWDECHDRVKQLLTGPERPTAVICHSDALALDTMVLAGSMGIRIPEDLSIFNIGDQLHDSRLTAICYPLEELGRAATTILQQTVKGQDVESCCLKGKLVERTTCTFGENGNPL